MASAACCSAAATLWSAAWTRASQSSILNGWSSRLTNTTHHTRARDHQELAGATDSTQRDKNFQAAARRRAADEYQQNRSSAARTQEGGTGATLLAIAFSTA
ncbi:hypothetical protein M3J09_007669 [Ascochyta lentis]